MQLCKLKEVIWEITNECKNGCTYCGSKELRGCVTTVPTILGIAKQLSEYPPEELNISGGDPLLVSPFTHQAIHDMLYGKTKLKLLFNPLSFNNTGLYMFQIEEIFDYYELIGVSINTTKELMKMTEHANLLTSGKFVVITNFNTGNIFKYPEIEAFVKEYDLSWQIQYTTYKGLDDNALYQNESAKKVLFDLIDKSYANGVKLVLADDLNEGICSAGQYSCGILANGDIVPCLSMRSWLDDIYVAGNILMSSMEDIWSLGFAKYRCQDCQSCKDICNSPYKQKYVSKLNNLPIYNEPSTHSSWDYPNIAMAYGVQPSVTMMYAVQQLPPKVQPESTMTFRYGVKPFGQ